MNRTVAIVAVAGLAAAAAAQPTIRLRYAEFDPAAATPHVPASLAAHASSRIWIVQFHATPRPADRVALESRGLAILRYVPDHAYVVRAPEGLNPAAIPGVRWAGPYHGAYKLDASLLAAALAPQHAHPAPTRCGIEFLESGAPHQVELDAVLRTMGSHVEAFNPPGYRVEALLTPAQIAAIACLDAVSFIDPAGPMGADMDIVRPLSGATYLETQIGATGQGVRGEVLDVGIDLGHPAFQNPPPLLHGPNAPTPSHAFPYAIVFANDPLDPLTRGMLPDRQQGIFAWYGQFTTFGGGLPFLEHLKELVDPNKQYKGVFITSSVGSAQISTYSTISAEMDDVLFRVDIAMSQSMSNLNNTSARPQAWAKNIIAVGGINHNNTLTREDDGGSGASFGYAADGRMKPDVAHVYDNVQTISPTPPTPPYSQFSGTSSSTPIVAGHLGLICQLWHEEYFPGFGGGASVFHDRPRASTIRALLVNSAYQYDWTTGTGPNTGITRHKQGWGMPDLQPLLDRAPSTFVVNETDVLLPQGIRTYHLDVPPGETAFKATMVYMDPQGNPAVQTQHRVNDLTLRVISPGGLVYWGNWGLTAPTGGPGHGIWSQSGGTPDTKNVIENVFVQDPRPGQWTIEVSAPELVMDARLETPEIDADFALVVSGVLVDEPCYPDCNGSNSLTIADFACFQAAFASGDPYADCNGSTTLTIADFACFQAAFAAGCP